MTFKYLRDIKETMFGGEKGEEYNALMQALKYASEYDGSIYKFLEETPKTSLIVKLVDALHSIGYKIQKE